MTRSCKNPLFKLAGALLALGLLVSAVEAQSDVASTATLVIKPGAKLQPKDPNKLEMGRRLVVNATRKIFKTVVATKFAMKQSHVTVHFKGARLGLVAAENAKPGSYPLSVTYRVMHQRCRVVGRKLQWVDDRLVDEVHRLNVIVDIPELPDFQLAVGAKTNFRFPDGVKLLGAKLSKKSIAKITGLGTKLAIEGVRKGSSNFQIAYGIGPQRFERMVNCKVSDHRCRMDQSVPGGGRAELLLDQLRKHARLKSILLISVDSTALSGVARIDAPKPKADRIIIHRLQPGPAVLYVTVSGTKSGKKPVHVTFAVDLT